MHHSLNTIIPTPFIRLLLVAALILLIPLTASAEPLPGGLTGDWTLNLESGEPAWLRVENHNGQPKVYFRMYIGPLGPHDDAKWNRGHLSFSVKRSGAQKRPALIQAEYQSSGSDAVGKLSGTITQKNKDGSTRVILFTGHKIPSVASSPPDLDKVRFGHPISLFNGVDLAGWSPHEQDKINGWSVRDGLLVNTTPKTDFSDTGAYANLKTDAVFEDFWLHIEFLVGKNRNSGVYLRGMYEAQVLDRDSRMQGIQGVGAIFGVIEPTINAGLPGGQWQKYDITLVDRHITVILNGKKVIDNQPLPRPTAAAILTDPTAPGPIYLQGDHTEVAYRNIYLAPVLREQQAR